ncbi:MAG: DNA-primase RepB domain-containing protein [Spirosomataceae bacterium]
MNALENYLNTLKAECYDVRLIHTDRNKYIYRHFLSKNEFLDKIRLFQKMNCDGYNVYCRPIGYEFVLVDDVRFEHLEKAATFRPSALIETSPNNFQLWYILKETPASREQAKAICVHLANELNGDLASAEPDHIGRLPTFTNRKPKYQQNGLFPFVKLHRWQFRYSTLNVSDFSAESVFDAHSESKIKAHRKGIIHDNSRSGQDFNLACMLIRKGFDDTYIYQRLKAKSEKAKEQKDSDKYIELTIAKARKVVNL